MGNKNFVTDLNTILDDETMGRSRLRSLVLLYFVSQVWHVAELIQQQGLSRPSTFVFSGNGSHILNVLGGEEFLGDLVTYVFDFVASRHDSQQESHPIKVMFNPEPKEATARGALANTATQSASPEVRLLIAGDRLVSPNDGAKYLAQDEAMLHQDLDILAELFAGLDRKLRLVNDWSYDKDSLEDICKMLQDKHRNQASFDSYVKTELLAGDDYSQSIVFSLLEHRIKDIGYELYKPQR